MKKICKQSKKNTIRNYRNFVDILQTILENKRYQSIIRWSDNERQIKIIDKNKFESKVIPNYFNHANFNSFKRQLNFYQFEQSRDDKGILSFENPNFTKSFINFDRIKRRKAKKSELYILREENNKLQDTLRALCAQQQQISQQLILTLKINKSVRSIITNFTQSFIEQKALAKTKFSHFLTTYFNLCRGIESEHSTSLISLINNVFPYDEETPNLLKEDQKHITDLSCCENVEEYIDNIWNSDLQSQHSISNNDQTNEYLNQFQF